MQNPANPPQLEYTQRVAALHVLESKDVRRDKALGIFKIFLFAILIALSAWLIKYHPAHIFLAMIPALALLFLIVLHERVLQSLHHHRRLLALYQSGLARLEDRWIGTGTTGEPFLEPSHPYARDLDIFGRGSIFELLCTARTYAGEQTLARWLLIAASTDEILARQAAVQELRPRLALRESLATTGEDVRAQVRPELLSTWGEGAQQRHTSALRSITAMLALLWIVALVVWALRGQPAFFMMISTVNLTFTWSLRKRVHQSALAIGRLARDLSVLAKILACIEQEKFSAAKLVAVQSELHTPAAFASHAIARLSRWIHLLESNHNWFVKILNSFIFWTAQCSFALEDWRVQHGSEIRRWLAAVGEMEALSSLACYAYEHPENVFPEFVDDAPFLHATGLSHPLLPADKAVANDLQLDSALQLLMISGPNMAGKSTFLRGVGVNVVLAQCGAPVRATRLVLSSFAVTASICVLDSLQGGVSRFYAEIQRLKHISDLAEGSIPVLFLLDELLSGTNSHDRRQGTELIIKSLVRHGAIGLVTTHDLALTEIVSAMEQRAANVHFSDQFENGTLSFDYQLHPGIVQTSNALQLMRSIGLKI